MNDPNKWFRFSLLAVLWGIVIELNCIYPAIEYHR
jgi:hypothetical protein